MEMIYSAQDFLEASLKPKTCYQVSWPPEQWWDVWASPLWKCGGVSLESSSSGNEGVRPPLRIVTGMYVAHLMFCLEQLMWSFKKIFLKFFRLLVADVVRADIPLSFPGEKLLIWMFICEHIELWLLGKEQKLHLGWQMSRDPPFLTAGLVPLHISHFSLLVRVRAICPAHGR